MTRDNRGAEGRSSVHCPTEDCHPPELPTRGPLASHLDLSQQVFEGRIQLVRVLKLLAGNDRYRV